MAKTMKECGKDEVTLANLSLVAHGDRVTHLPYDAPQSPKTQDRSIAEGGPRCES